MGAKAYEDRRIRLDSPTEIHINDRLQRNGEYITAVALDDETGMVLVSTRYSTVPLDPSQETWVWREGYSDDSAANTAV